MALLTRLLWVFIGGSLALGATERRPNVLFIAIDDLRPELGCYGSAVAKTPNIDRLAQSGVVFERQYVQFAVCIPSRAAIFTSLSPERTHQIYGNTVWDQVPGVRTWGNVFHDAGYATVSLGKIWHVIGRNSDKFDVAKPTAGGGVYGNPANRELHDKWRGAKQQRGGNKGDDTDLAGDAPIVEAYDGADEDYIDGGLANEAIVQLERLKAGDQPFMLAVGFHKPHIPFVAPKRYWDLYDRATLPLPVQPDYPQGAPSIAYSRNPNFHNYNYEALPGLPKGDERTEVMPEASARAIRHGYLACVSFVDAQVGRVLAALESAGLAENTIVVLWGDHGYHLGDLNQWGKQTNFETAARSPLIVRAPGYAAGRRTPAIVEAVDILPTLLDLCAAPPLAVTDGTSFTPLLKNPELPGKAAAFHVFSRMGVAPSAKDPGAKPELIIGHAVRTANHRLVEWRVGWSLSGELVATELYDYSQDGMEVRNVADDPAYAVRRQALAQALRDGPARLNP